MQRRLEITLKPELMDPEGKGLVSRAKDYFGIELSDVETVRILTFDADLTEAEFETVNTSVFCNPVTQTASFAPLDLAFDWCIWVGFRPGVRDNAGATAIEAMTDVLGRPLEKTDAVYTSRRYCIKGENLTREMMDKVAGELLANDIIQQWKIWSKEEWDKGEGVGLIIPEVRLDHTPTVTTIPVTSDAAIQAVSDARNLALNPNDIPVIREYFQREEVRAVRREKGLSDPTDIEIEYIAQGRSDHCNHNTFTGKFAYTDKATGETRVVDNLFKTCIQKPTKKLQSEKDWVVSVLWDNAGAARFDDEWNYVITGETHNSPSNMEAYGGAITGIVGVYRDPLGTGKGARLIMGSYGFCVGDRDYDGDLNPRLHPRRLLDGIVEGVKDGGNKSGVPTPFGQVTFDNGYLGKSLVFVTALGIMPKTVAEAPSHEKVTSPGEFIIMCGGRVGKDGIHGVTASSETFSENTPAGHVQIGDPYTQKKMHDFILEARDEGLIAFITDNGGGGLSSSIGESARFAGGCVVDLDKVPTKYDGLDQWEIWVSESQERMTVSVKPEHVDRFMALAEKHAVESTVIGVYTDSGYLEIRWDGETVAYIHMDLLEEGFPQWEFDCEWQSPELRGLTEPVVKCPKDLTRVLENVLTRPNLASKEWITRQYDHEVQANSVVKPLVGSERDVPSDASVIRPVLSSERGIAFTQTLVPQYSKIDAYHMTAATIDEAVRRLVAVGSGLSEIGGVDNFCWPDIQFDAVKNPDGKFKAAQLVRSCDALKTLCEKWEMPLLSGKDSMYVDGYLESDTGVVRKVSGLPTIQFSATGMVEDVRKCVTMDVKNAGDLVYVIGETKHEMGASEYYDMMDEVGLSVPVVDADSFPVTYKAVEGAICSELVESCHAVSRGGLGVHLALCAMGGNLGMRLDLGVLPESGIETDRHDVRLFSESCGRFVVTVKPANKAAFEALLAGSPVACLGEVTQAAQLVITADGSSIVNADVNALKASWKQPFGDLS